VPESTTPDAVGVAVPTSWAGEVAHHLGAHGNQAPVLVLPSLPGWWVFLAGTRDDSLSRFPPPLGVRYLADPPRLQESPGPRWIAGPGGHGDELPRLDVVLHAIRATRPSGLRLCLGTQLPHSQRKP
jgi:hypothetical protein